MVVERRSPLGLAIGFLARSSRRRGLQFVTDVVWISALGIHYKLGVDGLNVVPGLLTTSASRRAAAGVDLREWERPRLFYFHFMLAESAVLGAFCAQDLALFVAFFDLMLIPFYFLIGTGAGPDRVRATIKLVIYTLVGSLLMLAAAVATGVLASSQHGAPLTFVLSSLPALPLSHGSQEWIFLCLRRRLPGEDAGVPAPRLDARRLPGDADRGAGGLLRRALEGRRVRLPAIVLPLFPQAAVHFQTLMLLIALASILYGSLLAFTQTDARLIVGYSSVAQLGFITLGHLRAATRRAPRGRCCRWSTTALVVAPLLFIVALLAARAGGSEDIRDMGGIAFRAPVLAGAVPDRRAGDAGDARLVELRRRVPDPARRVQSQARDRDRSPSRASSAPACTRCGCSSARCTTASGPRVDSREISPARRASCSCRWSR